jgi:hypothetical protein
MYGFRVGDQAEFTAVGRRLLINVKTGDSHVQSLISHYSGFGSGLLDSKHVFGDKNSFTNLLNRSGSSVIGGEHFE